jgi:hypothetical protein
MTYIQRHADGRIKALFAEAGPDHLEMLAPDDPAIAAFLGRPPDFEAIDADFIRVIEDVIDALMDRGLLRLTDLPADAQRKLLTRKGARERLRHGLKLLGDDDVI